MISARPAPVALVATAVLALAAGPPAVALDRAPSASSAPAPDLAHARTLEDCDAILRDRPLDYVCYKRVARRARGWTAAIRRLEGRLAVSPGDLAARLALGTVMADSYDPRAESELRRAAAGLAGRGDAEAEGAAHAELVTLLMHQSRETEARAEMESASQDALRAGSAALSNRVEHLLGVMALNTNDLAGAQAHLKKVESALDPTADPILQALVASALGSLAYHRGDYQEALDDHRRAVRTFRAADDEYDAADGLVRISKDLSALAGTAGVDSTPEEDDLDDEAMRVARATGNLAAEESLLFGNAQDPRTLPPGKLLLLDQALADARRMRSVIQTLWVLRYKARVIDWLDRSRLPEAEAILEDAIRTAHRFGDDEQAARGMLQRAALHQDHGDRPRAIPEWLATLDALEGVRDRQVDEESRAGFEAAWAFLYYRVAAYFLQEPGPATAPEDLDRALAVIERMRARALLDTLDAAGASAGGAETALRGERDDLLRAIARTQRGLLNPGLTEEERTRSLADLDRLEAQEATLRYDIARDDPWFARLRAPVLPSVQDIQEALAPDQALMSFQSPVSGEEPGWAVAIARGAVRAYPIPARVALRNEIPLFLGLLERRDGSEAAGAARLYKELLAYGLKDLPGGVRRLVIVPDGPLHALPWDALRTGAAAPPLAALDEITLAPSCSAWMRWDRAERGGAREPLLAVADPLLAAASNASSSYRAATLASGLRLGPLPGARAEARALVRSLGGGSRLVEGAEATERYIKQAALPRYRMLHLAAHAVVDDKHPERSAVLLAPGADDEDGLLQMREIVHLDLKGAVVVLSSCRSATGNVVEGEGVMGLAHAFFQAGAVAVVGGLWSLRDEETARLVERLADHLGEGRSVSSALAQARRDSIAAGAPAAAWSGLVLLGNGDVVPVPGGRPAPWPLSDPMLLALGLAGLAFGTVLLSVQKTDRSS